ncbi:hypothetical protein Tco_1047197, partial [Tanacetum coccineum]
MFTLFLTDLTMKNNNRTSFERTDEQLRGNPIFLMHILSHLRSGRTLRDKHTSIPEERTGSRPSRATKYALVSEKQPNLGLADPIRRTSLEVEREGNRKGSPSLCIILAAFGTVYSLKDKNQAKTDKTEHEMEKREKDKVNPA